MTVRPHKIEGAWMVDVQVELPDGRVIRDRKVVRGTKRDAEAFERERRSLILKGAFERAKKKREVPTVAGFVAEFLEFLSTSNRPGELTEKQGTLRKHLLPAFGSKRLNEIGSGLIERYKKTKLDSGLSGKTVGNHLLCLHRMLTVAEELEIIPHVPRFRMPKTQQPRFKFFDDAETERLLEAARELYADCEPHWWVAIVIGLRAGLRRSEIFALEWDDFDLKHRRLHVDRGVVRGVIGQTKSSRGRPIPLHADVIDALKRLPRKLQSKLVFCSPEGKHWSSGQSRRALARAMEAAGLPDAGWHALRHSCASSLARSGVPLPVVKAVLGHADISTTMRYAHENDQDCRDAIDRLGRHGNLTAKRKK